MIKAEWSSIFKNKMLMISLCAILFVPIIYAGLFLWSFWDPYGHLDKLPVALVNQDAGAKIDGEEKQLGKELAEQLENNKSLDFHLVSAEKAEKGMDDRKYYMQITIPKDFTKNAGTLLEDDPEKMKIKFTPNEGINYLGGQIGKSAIEKIHQSVNTEVSETYAEQLFENIAKMGDGYGDAADGAGKLKNGATKLADGATELNGGVASAADGAKQLNEGATSAQQGSANLADGVASAADGASQLADGANSAQSGASQLNEGIGSAKSGASELQSGSSQLKDGTASLVSGLEGNTSNIQALNAGAQSINTGVDSLSTGLGSLATGSQQVSDGVAQLVDGLGSMPAMVGELKTGVAQVNDGAAKLATGTQQVAQGTASLQQQIEVLDIPEEQKATLLATVQQVNAGAESTQSGAADLSVGTSELNNKVAAVELPATNDLSTLKAGAAQVASGAATMNDKVANELQPGTQQLAAGTEKLENNWGASVEGAKQLDNGAASLNNGISSLDSGLSQLQGGSSQLVNGLGSLNNGASELKNGMGQLQTGSNDLTNGLSSLADGTGTLVSGALKLENGTIKLADGTEKLKDGTKSLQGKLADASTEADKVHAKPATYSMVANPVKVDTKAKSPVENYGTGFAPYFLSMGLLIGGLVVTVVYSVVHPAIRPKNGAAWYLSKTTVLAVVGLLQAIIIVALVKLLLGLQVENLAAVFLLALVASYTFIALVQMFVTIFNDVGRFIVLILMVLQLTSSAGTFPLELIPKPLQAINDFMPMKYSIQGFKAAISTGDMHFFWQNIGILLCIIAGCSIITFGYFQLLFKKRFSGEATEAKVEAEA
ncbi:MAG: YhgE/Pip domain-containing protein [Kurthia sp.]|nr:YhgE/Pip domain-containing protein [Candidatus Kurthia equi]